MSHANFDNFVLFQIVSHAGMEIKDPDTRDDDLKDDSFTQITCEVVKAMFPGVKPEPSVIESCIYTVSLYIW